MTDSEIGYRCFCQVFVCLTIALLLLVATFNFVVNPYAQYAPRLFTPLVQTSRAEKVRLLGEADVVPDGLIFGSSRVLKIEPDYLQQKTGVRFFNAGMNYGQPEDHLALLRYYRDRFGRVPRMVVLGADLFSFTDILPPDARLLSNVALASRIPEAIELGDRMHRWVELLNWQQTSLSLKSVRNCYRPTMLPEPGETFRDDGLLVYHRREAQIAAGSYDFESALDYTKQEYRRLFSRFEDVSNKRCQLFERLVDDCQRGGAQVIVFLTPMHPDLVAYLTQTTEYEACKTAVTDYLQQQSADRQYAFWDLSQVDSFRGDPSLFLDGIHPLEPNTRRIVDRLLTPTPRKTRYVVQ